MNRRILLQRSMVLGAVGVAVSAGLLTPGQVLAAYPAEAFKAKDVPSALKAALGADSYSESGDIKIKAPDIAENGAVVPVTVSTGMSGVESISILADANSDKLIAVFKLPGAEPYVSTRIKMGKTGNVIAVVKSGGKLYAAKKEVKVTIGGCGG